MLAYITLCFFLITSILRYLFSIFSNLKVIFPVNHSGKMSIYFLSPSHCSIPSEAIYSFCNVSSLCSLLISLCHCVKQGLYFLKILNILAQSFVPSCIYTASKLIISSHFLEYTDDLLLAHHTLRLGYPLNKGQGSISKNTPQPP